MALLHLRPNKKLKAHLESHTNKIVTLQGLSNLEAKCKKDNLRNDLQATVKVLQDNCNATVRLQTDESK